MIVLKRAYEPPSPADGRRVLVERLWPRGVRKQDLELDEWAKPLAPSTELRKWYAHDPAKWDEFAARYTRELAAPAAQEALAALARQARRGRVTLLFAAHDPELSNARVLKELLDKQRAAEGD